MKICMHCKVENNDSANFCRQCGFAFPEITTTEGITDASLVNKVNELQTKVAASERKCESAKKELDNSKKQLRAMQVKLDHEHQMTMEAKAQELAAKEQTEKLRSSNIFWHVPYIMVIILIGMLYSNMENKRNILQHTVDTLESQNRTMSSVLRKLNTPLFIGDIFIRNDGEFYGSTIYSNNTIFIQPKVEIFSLIDGWTDIYVRLYTPYGLSKGASSPIGYTYHDEFNMEKNTTNICEFSGWKRINNENWRPGSYRFEFYYQNKCIGSKSFTIY